MKEMRVYIKNLGKYSDGEAVGAWFTAPINFDEVKERIGANDSYKHCIIDDYELPFDLDEYTSIKEINNLCEMATRLPELFAENSDCVCGLKAGRCVFLR